MGLPIDRYWFLTNTTYGTWLPGDPRGFVGRVWEHRPGDPADVRRVEHDAIKTPYDRGIPNLERASAARMKGPPIIRDLERAEAALAQFRETADFRKWSILAAAVLCNHFHILVGVPGDPEPGKVLADFKAWASRRLNRTFGEPPSKTWWTSNGSTRKCEGTEAVRARVEYTLYRQPNPLVTWSPETGLCYGIPIEDPASGGA